MDLSSGSERRAGGRGGGSGEFEGALMLLPGEGGGLLVGDMRQKRISQLDARRDFVRSAQVPGMPLRFLSVENDRMTAVWMRFGPGIEPRVGAVDLSSGQVDEGFSLFDPGVGLSRPAP